MTKRRGYTTIELIINAIFHIFAIFLLIALINAGQSHITLHKELYKIGSRIRAEHLKFDPPQELTNEICLEIADELRSYEYTIDGITYKAGINNIKGFNLGEITCEVAQSEKLIKLSYSSSYNSLFQGIFKSNLFSTNTAIVYNGR